jgi:hypothetical protein
MGGSCKSRVERKEAKTFKRIVRQMIGLAATNDGSIPEISALRKAWSKKLGAE